jgi:hypothetical protein
MMIGDAMLHLIAGSLVGVGIYYTYKKSKVQKTRLDEPILVGRGPPPMLPFNIIGMPHNNHEQKQHTSLKKTNELPPIF